MTNTVVVQAGARGRTVDASDAFETALTCPPGPPEPPVPPALVPGATGEPAVTPAGSDPPEAGVAGSSALSPLKGCLRRGSRVTIRGERIASIRVFVGGERVRGLRVRPLQDRATVKLTRSPAPGRYRATAVIRFQRGAATPTVRLTRQVRVCSAGAPRFTG